VREEGLGYYSFDYFAQQELSFDEYMALIRKRVSAESIEEFEAYIEDFTEHEDRISEAANKVWDAPDLDGSTFMIWPSMLAPRFLIRKRQITGLRRSRRAALRSSALVNLTIGFSRMRAHPC
jgi:hypothetical protein